MKKNLLFVILIIILGGVIYSCSDETIIDEQTVVPASAQIVRTDVFEGMHRLTLTIRGGGGVLSPMDETGKLGGTGYYSDGEIISLIAEEESFLYWIINGEQIEGSEVKLDITLNEDMDIVAVTKNCITITVTGAGTVSISGTGPKVTSANSPYKYFMMEEEQEVYLYAEGGRFLGWEYGSDDNFYLAHIGESVTAHFGAFKTMRLDISNEQKYASVVTKGYAYPLEATEPGEFEIQGSGYIDDFVPDKGLEVEISNQSRYKLTFVVKAPLGSKSITLSSNTSGVVKLNTYDFDEDFSFASVSISAS